MKGHKIQELGIGQRPIHTLNVLVRKDMIEYEVTENKALIGLRGKSRTEKAHSR